MTVILRKGTLWIINATSVSSLLRRLKQTPGSDHKPADTAEDCSRIKMSLITASKFRPSIFGLHIVDLEESLIKEDHVAITEVALRVLVALGAEVGEK